MWIDAGRTCDTDGSNTQRDWENGLITVKVSCRSIERATMLSLFQGRSLKLYNTRSYVQHFYHSMCFEHFDTHSFDMTVSK